jgi:hypothetical protein
VQPETTRRPMREMQGYPEIVNRPMDAQQATDVRNVSRFILGLVAHFGDMAAGLVRLASGSALHLVL